MKILIVDDDRTVCQSLRLLFLTRGDEVQYLINPGNILAFIERYSPDVLLLDLNFSIDTSGREGLKILSEVHRAYERLPVILITAWGSLDLAVQGMKSGASDFVTKPWDNESLVQKVETQYLLRQGGPKGDFDTALLGNSPAVVSARNLVQQAAASDATLWISGDRGTGKDYLASIYRSLGKRSAENLEILEAGAEVEWELWGYRKGAVPGASKDLRGLFSRVGEGIIQLDAWENFPPVVQSRLLRVLEERKYKSIGSEFEEPLRCGWLSTSRLRPEELIMDGLLREDLYYRLAQVHIHLPNLDERREDIPVLIQAFAEQLNQGDRKRRLEESAVEWLSTCSFPGNVRQLKGFLERVWLLSEGYTLTMKELKRYFVEEEQKPDLTLEGMEKEMIKRAIAQKKGNMSEVAKVLGITRSALYRRMSKFGIGNTAMDED
jgi:two-component system NtrC family response regulator